MPHGKICQSEGKLGNQKKWFPEGKQKSVSRPKMVNLDKIRKEYTPIE